MSAPTRSELTADQKAELVQHYFMYGKDAYETVKLVVESVIEDGEYRITMEDILNDYDSWNEEDKLAVLKEGDEV